MDGFTPIHDILARKDFSKPKRKVSERAILIGFFATELNRSPKQMGVRLAHYSVPDLCSIQSAYKDRLNRNGKEKADKYFWYITKTIPL